MLTAPRISISRVCPMSDLVRLEPGCQAATLWLSLSHSRGSLCEANRGYRVRRLLSTMDVLCMCANGKHTVKSLVPMREGRQPPETNGLIDLGLFGDAGSPQRYGYAMRHKPHPLSRLCCVKAAWSQSRQHHG